VSEKKKKGKQEKPGAPIFYQVRGGKEVVKKEGGFNLSRLN